MEKITEFEDTRFERQVLRKRLGGHAWSVFARCRKNETGRRVAWSRRPAESRRSGGV